MSEYNLDKKTYDHLKKLKPYKSDKEKWFRESYDVLIENSIKTKDDLIRVIAYAYSWMPTIPRVELPDNLNDIIKSLKNLNKVNDDELEKLLKQLIPIINNSIVGTSKVLHFIAPDSMPILDRRVLRAWNNLFGGNNELKLPSSMLAGKNHEKVANHYLKYRDCLRKWKEQCDNVPIRDLENLLYQYNG